MKTIKTLFCAIALWGLSSNVQAQLLGKMEQQIFDNVKGYDSLILTYSIAGMGHFSSVLIKGFGIKDKHADRLTITFKDKGYSYGDDRTSFDRIKIKHIHRKAITDSVSSICFSCIPILNDTALRWCMDLGGSVTSIRLHDASAIVLYTVLKDKYYFKYAYATEYFQHACPTKDRGNFIALIRKSEYSYYRSKKMK